MNTQIFELWHWLKKTDVPRSEVMRKVSLHFAQVLLAGRLLVGGVRLSIKYIGTRLGISLELVSFHVNRWYHDKGVENGSQYLLLYALCCVLCAICYAMLGLTWPEGKDDLEAKKAKTEEKEEKEEEAQVAWKPLPQFDYWGCCICVTRAPLLYFIRSWVALSFKVVSQSVSEWGIRDTYPDLHFVQYIKA